MTHEWLGCLQNPKSTESCIHIHIHIISTSSSPTFRDETRSRWFFRPNRMSGIGAGSCDSTRGDLLALLGGLRVLRLTRPADVGVSISIASRKELSNLPKKILL